MMDRDLVVARLEKDLVGPVEEEEVLVEAKPSDVYLTGILWPRRARVGAEEDDRLDSAAGGGGEDDTSGAGEEVPLVGLQRPCAAGLSFALTAAGQPRIRAVLEFALYRREERAVTPEARPGESQRPETAPSPEETETGESASRGARRQVTWRRCPFEIPIDLPVPPEDKRRIRVEVAGLPSGVSLHLRCRQSGSVMLVTLTVLNEMVPEEEGRVAIEAATMFQVKLSVEPGAGTSLIPKPDNVRDGHEEERSAALLYRECRCFAAGHTCSASWIAGPDGQTATAVATTWLPRFEVPRVHAGGHPVFEVLRADEAVRPLEAAWLGSAQPLQLRGALDELVLAYSSWIGIQRVRLQDLPALHRRAAEQNLARCEVVRDRMAAGARRIAEDDVLRQAFQLANRAIQLQHEWNPERRGSGPLRWRPFQLGFVLLSAASACDDEDVDREVMDLLWFPTGGGKTEAYLALVAMLAFYRRLSSEIPDERSGVAAVMRYTLRLLTTQQFVRAAALILACDVIRRDDTRSSGCSSRLGSRPFSIGLWLGGEATPNRFTDAMKALRGSRDEASPEQLTECPCCHARLSWVASEGRRRIEVWCRNEECEAGSGGALPLPVWTVDDDVYAERPTLLIGTIDKFAQLPRRQEVRALFGMGSMDSPDLIIQDELHLISGPLGTIAGVYEMAFDWLISRNGRRAKVIGSTATIRRAEDQVKALFNRKAEQFPPPGLDHHDSGFAVLDSESPGRLYVGVTTAGRSAKFTLQAVAGCLLQSGWSEIPDPARRDPYATLVAYFNSLRELGGALVLMQDDVNDSMKLYAGRHDQEVRPSVHVEELTSRRTQEEVRDMLDILATPCTEDGFVDVVLATSMVSVGVDVPRLGVMLVNGQPKTRSEYIQATSRVGRDRSAGLVVSILNNAKARDRSHYETFPIWHQSLYRDVEATSVTPFAPRARDRALHAALVAMVRNGYPPLNDRPQISDADRRDLEPVVEEIVARAAEVDPGETRVRFEVERLLNDWEARQPQAYWNERQPQSSLLQSAERAAALRTLGRGIGDAWPTMNNMRSVEPTVPFRLAERLRSQRQDRSKDEEVEA